MEETLKSILLCVENIAFSVIKKNNTTLVKFLLDNGIDVNSKDNKGNTLLHIACENGQSSMIDELNNYLPNVDLQNNDGNTPLHLAVLNNNLNCVQKMITLNANKEIKNNRKKTPLTFSIEKDFKPIYDYLVSNGSQVTSDDSWGSSILHHAAKNGNKDLLISYISANSDNKYTLLNKRDRNGNTPLYIAVYNNQLEFVKELITQGANVNIYNYTITYPLHVAVLKGNLDIVKELCENGAIIDIKNKQDNTPLKLSILKDKETIADYLLTKGANINIIDSEGRSVLHDAYNKGNLNLVNKIKNNLNFTKLNHVDKKGKKAEYYSKLV